MPEETTTFSPYDPEFPKCELMNYLLCRHEEETCSYYFPVTKLRVHPSLSFFFSDEFFLQKNIPKRKKKTKESINSNAETAETEKFVNLKIYIYI